MTGIHNDFMPEPLFLRQTLAGFVDCWKLLGRFMTSQVTSLRAILSGLAKKHQKQKNDDS